MSDKTIDLLSLRGKGNLAPAPAGVSRGNATPNPTSDEDECRAFSYLRGIRERALSFEFRFSTGILLKFTADQLYLVLLEGSNLNALVNGSVSLYDRGIQRHRVTWVREMTKQEAARAGEGEVAVRCIRMLSNRHGEGPKDVTWLKPFQERN